MQSRSSAPIRAGFEALRIATLGASVLAAFTACSSHGDSAADDESRGGTGANVGGQSAASAGMSITGSAGTRTTTGFAGVGGAAGYPPSSTGGGLANSTGGGLANSSGGAGGLSGPPDPMADGLSAYQRECHGDTAMCVDVNALRCLGIRDDTTVYGYSCSNPCATDADCSDAPSSGEARAGCVDFVTQKHCLLVCLDGGAMKACPTGMNCYVYPSTTLGYCLWP